ncbi:unnamed protein product [Brassica oleracea var. botrytis]
MEFSGCSSLKELKLRYTAIEEMPSSISTWSCLYKLDMTGCRNLKEFPNVSDSINELELCNTGIEEVPPWIENLLGLRKLLMYGCGKLKTISPNISKLKNLYFLGLSFCIILHKLDVSGCRDLVALPQLPESSSRHQLANMRSYRVKKGKQNGLTVGRGSTQLQMLALYGRREHLYIFEESFSLNQDCPEAEETTFSELSFVFRVHDKPWKVKGCGVRLLEEDPHCILDEKENEDEECMGINIEANNENASGEHDEDDDDEEDDDDDNDDKGCDDVEGAEDEDDSVGEDDDVNEDGDDDNDEDDDDDGGNCDSDEDESGDDEEGAEDEEYEVGDGHNDDVEEDIEDDVNDNDAGFSDAIIDINIKARNKTEEEEESGRDENAEARTRKRMRLSPV